MDAGALGERQQVPRLSRQARENVVALAAGAERNDDNKLAIVDGVRRNDSRRQNVENGTQPRRLARETDVVGDDAYAAMLANRRAGRRHDEAAAVEAKRHEAIPFVVGFDHAFQTDCRVSSPRQRQRRIALQLRQRPRCDHMAFDQQHHVIGEAFDLREVMCDVEDRQRQTVAQPLEERQDLALCHSVERGQRLIHQQQLGLRKQRPANRYALAFAAGRFSEIFRAAPSRRGVRRLRQM